MGSGKWVLEEWGWNNEGKNGDRTRMGSRRMVNAAGKNGERKTGAG